MKYQETVNFILSNPSYQISHLNPDHLGPRSWRLASASTFNDDSEKINSQKYDRLVYRETLKSEWKKIELGNKEPQFIDNDNMKTDEEYLRKPEISNELEEAFLDNVCLTEKIQELEQVIKSLTNLYID